MKFRGEAKIIRSVRIDLRFKPVSVDESIPSALQIRQPGMLRMKAFDSNFSCRNGLRID